MLNILFGFRPKLFSGVHDSGLFGELTHPASFLNAGPFGPFFSYNANVNSSPGANARASTSNAPHAVAVISIPRSNASSGFCCERTMIRAPMFFFHVVGSGRKSNTCNGAHAVCNLIVFVAAVDSFRVSTSPRGLGAGRPIGFPPLLKAIDVATTAMPDPARTFVHFLENVDDDFDDAKSFLTSNASSSSAVSR